MATSAVQVTGLRELGRSLERLSAEVRTKIARRATGAGAAVVKAAVKDHALRQPTLADEAFTHEGVTYEPGHIARNVISKHLGSGAIDSEHIVAVRSNKGNGYAGRIASLNEFGTVKMAAQPFMRRGFEESKVAAVNAIAAALGNGIAAAARVK